MPIGTSQWIPDESEYPWCGEVGGLLRSDFMVAKAANPTDQRRLEPPRCSRSWPNLPCEGLQQKPVRSRHLVRCFWQAGVTSGGVPSSLQNNMKSQHSKFRNVKFNLILERSCPIQCGSVLTQFDWDLIGLMFNHSSWLRFDWIDVQTFCDIERVDTNNEPRSFKVVYATAVRSDSSYIVSTNRGHLAEIRCNMMQQFLENCSMNMCVLEKFAIKIWTAFVTRVMLGVALGSLVRRRPNCFNLLHQLQFLERSGMSQDMTVKSLEAFDGTCRENRQISSPNEICIHINI